MMNCEGFSDLVCLKENLICGMILGNSEPFFETERYYQKRGYSNWNNMVMIGKSLH